MHKELPNELETHRAKVNVISSELIRSFLHEFYAITQDRSSSTQLTNHTLNTTTHYRPEITLEASEFRDGATKTSMLRFIRMCDSDLFSSIDELQQLPFPGFLALINNNRYFIPVILGFTEFQHLQACGG